MEKLQITKGEYTIDKYGSLKINGHTVAMNGVVIPMGSNDRKSEANQNKELLKDSLNTYQQCETLPSELLRQNREMKEALDEIVKQAPFKMKRQIMDIATDCLTSCNKGKE